MRWTVAVVGISLFACVEPPKPPAPPPPAPEVPLAVIKQAGQDGPSLFVSKTCVACHGKDAKTPTLPTYPRIAGQQVAYVEQQMKDIKSGARSNANTAAMRGIMPLVNDDELHTLAEFVSGLPGFSTGGAAVPPPPPTSKLDGAALFTQKTCNACHGPDAKTPIMPVYPRIAGQQVQYAEQQLKDIKSGKRSNGNTAAMKAIMVNVNDEEIHALAEYVAGLK